MTFLTPDNATRQPYTLSQFGAWLLLTALKREIKDANALILDGDDDGIERMRTAVTELQHLHTWFLFHDRYGDWQEAYDDLEQYVLFSTPETN